MNPYWWVHYVGIGIGIALVIILLLRRLWRSDPILSPPPPYEMTPERLQEIEEDDLGDDTSGWLIRSSTLQWLIEREVNRERQAS